MIGYTKKLLLLLIPLLLFGTAWGISWRRLHPPPTALDKQIRDLLISANRVDVKVEAIEPAIGDSPPDTVNKFVTRLSPTAVESVVRSINLTAEQPYNWGTGYVPIVCFDFYKKGRILGSLSTSYSVFGFNYFLDAPYKEKIRRGLHPTTTLRLRQLIAKHPEIMRAIVAAGAEPQYLNPDAITPNKP